jgi:hypothetical protein
MAELGSLSRHRVHANVTREVRSRALANVAARPVPFKRARRRGTNGRLPAPARGARRCKTSSELDDATRASPAPVMPRVSAARVDVAGHGCLLSGMGVSPCTMSLSAMSTECATRPAARRQRVATLAGDVVAREVCAGSKLGTRRRPSVLSHRQRGFESIRRIHAVPAALSEAIESVDRALCLFGNLGSVCRSVARRQFEPSH